MSIRALTLSLVASLYFAGVGPVRAGELYSLPHDLSPWAMFLAADIVVKAVIIGLAFASVLAWSVFLGKLIELRLRRRQIESALDIWSQSPSLAAAADQASNVRGAPAAMIAAAQREIAMSELASKEGVKERVASRLSGIVSRSARDCASGTGVLASIGATGPFVGLFGTVWGIMNSFIGISKAQTSNLAVVAPGIAEALLATAIGLVAAIPAVLFYNYLVRLIGGQRALMSEAGEEIQRLVSRDLDRLSVRQRHFEEAGHGC